MLSKPFIGNYPPGQPFGANFRQLADGKSYYEAEGLLGHGGQDFPMPDGTPVIAACDGVVVFVSTDQVKGEGVTIRSNDTFQAQGQDCKLSCVYWHLKDKSIVVKVGDNVKTGQLLGLSNNTGQTTGPHLHFGVFPLALDGTRELFINNGYKGAVDPLPYLDLETQQSKNAKELQTFLNNHGAKLTVDGKWGKISKAALDKFIG